MTSSQFSFGENRPNQSPIPGPSPQDGSPEIVLIVILVGVGIVIVAVISCFCKCLREVGLVIVAVIRVFCKCLRLASIVIVAVIRVFCKCLRLAGIVIVAIIRILYKCLCLRKTESSTSTNIQRVTSNASEAPPSNESDSVVTTPIYPIISDSVVREGTIEIFLSNIAREKPIRYSPQQLSGFTQNFTTYLGSGAFGMVYKGEFPDGVKVAIKVLNSSSKRVEEQFMAEVSTIGRTYHFNLVRLYGFCFDSTMRALVYEYMEKGSLDGLLFSNNFGTEWEKLHQIAIGTAKGIAYLHEDCEKRIIHYDIKPENVLLDANLSPKVGDFGLAKLCDREISHIEMTNCRGTPGYAAPELYKPYPLTHKCDVYSFGMLLFEIVGRRRNFNTDLNDSRQWLPRWTWKKFKNNELAELVLLCGIEEKDREKAEKAFMVALWCVQYLPEARPIMSTVVKMLEGEIEITPPPNPFEYVESNEPLNDMPSGSIEGSDV